MFYYCRGFLLLLGCELFWKKKIFSWWSCLTHGIFIGHYPVISLINLLQLAPLVQASLTQNKTLLGFLSAFCGRKRNGLRKSLSDQRRLTASRGELKQTTSPFISRKNEHSLNKPKSSINSVHFDAYSVP